MTENNHIVVPEGINESERLAKELAIKRQKMIDLDKQISKAEADLLKLKAVQAVEVLHDEMCKLIEQEKEIEQELRSTALEVGIELQMKNPAPGVTITKKTTFTIDDPNTALEACRDSYPQLIEEKIKKAELKKIVVALGEAIKGTTLVEDEYGQVKISTKLAEHYLPDDGNGVPF